MNINTDPTHFRDRMWEWINENFETVPNANIPKNDKWFIDKIRKRENAHQYSKSDSIRRRTIWTIKFLGKWCFVVYDEAQRRCTTVLPNKWLDDHLKKRARDEKIAQLEFEISEEKRIAARQQRFIEEILAKKETRRMARKLTLHFQNC